MSQIFCLGPSFNFMNPRKIIMEKNKKNQFFDIKSKLDHNLDRNYETWFPPNESSEYALKVTSMYC